jgi:hypothetical protein
LHKEAEQEYSYWNYILPEIEKRGIVLGKSLFNTHQQYDAKVCLDESNILHWPVMFLYEEYNQSDFIRDFSEAEPFINHLSYMFPPDNYPPWDKEKKYVANNLEIYFEAGSVETLKKSTREYKKRWIKVKLTTSLGKVLSHPDYVVPGKFPVFHIVASDSKFKGELLKKKSE